MVVRRVVGGLSVGRERRWSLPLLTGHSTSHHEEWADSRGIDSNGRAFLEVYVCVCMGGVVPSLGRV